MIKFQYVGPEVNMGRFGNIRKGDVLDLTGREAEHIAKDNRFKKYVEGEKAAAPAGLKLPDDFESLSKEEQKEQIAKAEQAEADRQAALENVNSKTAVEDIDQMNKEQLLNYAKRLKDAGTVVEFKPDANKKDIKRAISKALGQEEGPAETESESAD